MTSVITDFIVLVSGSLVLSILAKATLILLIGIVAGAIAVRAQASWRHLVFAMTFAAVLALPLAVIAIPELAVEFAATPVEEVQRETPTSVASPPNTSAPTIASTTESRTHTSDAWTMPSVMTLVLSVWIAGVVFLMLSLVADLLRVRHLRRHGLPFEKLRETIERLTVDARMKPVDVMLHERIAAPVTFGFFQPVIMLPTDAEDWQPADLRRALVHELEHIRRGDWATQLVARVACAFYWFHPLIWMAWRKLCLEAERACDDAVVQTAGNTEYAEQLVSLARQLTASPSQPVLGMAKRSDLTMRISSLLDTSRGRGRATAAAAVLAVFIASLVVILIGPLRAVAQSVQKKESVAVKESPNEKVFFKADYDDDDDDEDRGKNPLDWRLFKAAERNTIDQAAKLMEEGANVNAIFSGDGTALIAASRAGHLEMVRFLLDRGAKPNIGVAGDGNALTNAASKGHRDVVVLLLDRGADIDAGVEGDGNALIAASGGGFVDIVTLLLDRGADIHKVIAGDENPLIKASETGQLDVVKLLVARGADVNSSVRVHVGMVSKINDNGMVSKMVEEVRTPLSMARKGGHAAVVEYLLSAGAK